MISRHGPVEIACDHRLVFADKVLLNKVDLVDEGACFVLLYCCALFYAVCMLLFVLNMMSFDSNPDRG